MGEQSVKNIARSVRVFRVAFDPNGTTELTPAGQPEQVAAASKLDGADLAGTVLTADETAIELAFWTSVKDSSDPDEYLAYLNRYPDGTFAELARARLESPVTQAVSPEEHQIELAFWNSVKDSDNPAMIRAYLDRFPNGEFRILAELLLKELDGQVQT
jgi:adenylate cyclase